MTAEAVIMLLLQVLPFIVQDISQVTALFDTASTAIKNAQASSNGLVSAEDWQSMLAATSVDLKQLAADAGIVIS